MENNKPYLSKAAIIQKDDKGLKLNEQHGI